jgi:hypothetical protein
MASELITPEEIERHCARIREEQSKTPGDFFNYWLREEDETPPAAAFVPDEIPDLVSESENSASPMPSALYRVYSFGDIMSFPMEEWTNEWLEIPSNLGWIADFDFDSFLYAESVSVSEPVPEPISKRKTTKRKRDNDLYNVEAILDHHAKSRTFLVKWEGYSEASWVSIENLMHNYILADYLKKNRRLRHLLPEIGMD